MGALANLTNAERLMTSGSGAELVALELRSYSGYGVAGWKNRHGSFAWRNICQLLYRKVGVFHVKHFDVLVVGGGHAGTEAAAAASRAGARTALLTLRAEAIGTMSCNPAIGGLGKGHLVREIDALDGIMGVAADRAGIQFRLLNRRKGPAVQGPRAQADRKLYRTAIQELLAAQPCFSIVEGEVASLLLGRDRCVGVTMSNGTSIGAHAVVLTAGTFLNGIIHVGDRQRPGGRVGDSPHCCWPSALGGDAEKRSD